MGNITAVKRVLAGAEFLTGIEPGWQDTLDIEEVSMHDGGSCILGQLYGGYESGLSELDLTNREARDYGFDDDYSSSGVTYDQLTKAWKDLLTMSSAKKYFDKHTNFEVRVIETIRLDSKNYVIYHYLKDSTTPVIDSLSSFMRSFTSKEYNWEVGQVLKAANGKLFMVADDNHAWRLSDITFGSSYATFKDIEKESGALAAMKTVSGHNLVGGMNMHTCKTK